MFKFLRISILQFTHNQDSRLSLRQMTTHVLKISNLNTGQYNYEGIQQKFGCLEQNVLFLDSLYRTKIMKQKIDKLQKNIKVKIQNPNKSSTQRQSDLDIFKDIEKRQILQENLFQHIQELQKNKKYQNNQSSEQNTSQSNALIWKDLFKMFFQMYKNQWILVIVLAFIQVLLARFSISILIFYLFKELINQNFKTVYIYAAICSFLYLTSCYCYNAGQYFILNLSVKCRYNLLYAINKKLMSLSDYTLKKTDVGKILNIISIDLNMIEDKIQYATKFIVFIPYFISISTLLIIRFGWPSIIGLTIFIISWVLVSILAKVNTQTLLEITKIKDDRIRILTQFVQGIKFIKIFTWQIIFGQFIANLRKKQVKLFYKWCVIQAVIKTCSISSANVIGSTILLILHSTNSSLLDTAAIFNIFQILIFLRFSSNRGVVGAIFFQETVNTLTRYASIFNIEDQNMICLNNVQKDFTNNEEIKLNQKKQSERSFVDSQELKNIQIRQKKQLQMWDGEIILENFSIYWDKNVQNIQPTLKNINLHVKSKSFVGLSGRIGSGKTTLIHALIQQIPYYKGNYYSKGSISYVEQNSIIFPQTVKQNIVFQREFNEERYKKVLNLSCFQEDLVSFPNHDDTLVGEKGITLSGGQKIRLTLARALYSDSSILVLDDPFSALDSKVGKKIYKNLVSQLKGFKTIVLSTHHVQYFQKCDEIVYLSDNTIQEKGSYQKLKDKLLNNLPQMDQLQIDQIVSTKNKDQQEKCIEKIQPINLISTQNFDKQSFVQASLSALFRYLFFPSQNCFLIPIAIIIFILSQLANVFAFRLLANYDDYVKGNFSYFQKDDKSYWISVGCLHGFYFLSSLMKSILTYIIIFNCNRKIHDKMIKTILRAPLSYFDYLPSGQIVNKFSNDIGILDYTMSFNFLNGFEGLLSIIIISIMIFTTNVYLIIPGLIFLFSSTFIFCYLKKVVIKLKQFDMRSKSPIFSYFLSSVQGIVQLRALNKVGQSIKTMKQLILYSSTVNYTFSVVHKGFSIYIYYIGIFSLISIIFIGIHTKQSVGYYAMSVVIYLICTDFIGFVNANLLNIQGNIINVARCFEIVDLKLQEQFYNSYDKQNGIKQPQQQVQVSSKQKKQVIKIKEWPINPNIQVKNLSLKYRSQFPKVLKNISFNIKSKQKVGIVGRTGAGKSSIIQALLRLTEPEADSLVYIDGLDANQMGLHSLRRKISVIPQKGFFFKGTIKKNLDPFEKFTDQQIFEALKQSNLYDSVNKLTEKLETKITIIQSVFSFGEQQLLSLARVLLQKNKILILDQATSNVDNQTDKFIQHIIKQKFVDSTIITIAHRLLTIADYDKIIVLKNGKVEQYGAPYQLIQKRGQFYQMVQHSGLSKEKIMELIQKKKVQKQFNQNSI